MLLRVLLEGVGLGVILMLVCAVGIRNGAVGMVHLYHADVQERCVTLGYTKAWTIPGTEQMKPYINAQDKKRKWLFGTLGMLGIAAILAGIMALILR